MIRALAAVGRLLRALTAFAVLGGFIAGVPWLLVQVVGWPLSWLGWRIAGHLPSLGDIITAITNPWSDHNILAIFATLGWLLWLQFCRDVAIEVIETAADAADARRGQKTAPTIGGRGPVQWVAAVLVGAIAGAILFDTLRGAMSPTQPGSTAAAVADAAARRPAVAVAAAQPAPIAEAPVLAGPRPALAANSTTITSVAAPMSVAATGTSGAHLPRWAQEAPGGVHHVVKYDNLWDIAKHELGDPNRWREIYILNRGHVQANGYALTDPDEIHIGWVLALPANDAAPAAPAPGHTEPPAQTDPAAPATPAAPAAPAPSAIASADPSPAVLPSANSASTAPTAPIVSTPSASAPAPNETQHHVDRQAGVSMPSQGWVSLGLAATIAAVAALLRLHRRRRARLGFPIPIRTGPHPAPVPPPLAAADAAGTRELNLDPDTQTLPGVLPAPPAVPAPVGVDTTGAELSLFDLPGPGIALHGAGAQAVARAVLASTLATGILETMSVRPVVVTTTDTLAQLLPEGVEPAGLDPDRTSFDGERLIVLTDTAAAVTHAEEEMIHRRRLLDTFDADSVTALNARTDHAEHQPPYLLLVQGNDRYAARIGAVAAHRTALHLHTVILGDLDGIPGVAITTDGTPDSSDAQASASTIGRLATLGPANLAQVLAMLTEAAPRPERGIDIDDPIAVLEQAPTAVSAEVLPDIPAPSSDAPAPVRLTVLGPVTVTTDVGPVTTGMRSGSYTVLAVLAAHPTGRTLDQITACLYPDADPGAVNRVRTDITSARKVLRAATGDEEQRFIVYDPAATRYRLDPDSIEVDLWRMLTAIGAANTAADDAACLTALHQAAGMYRGDFADGQDRAWAADYATTYRHQILNVYARIAELLEADQPDQAVAALERAMDLDPVNEELYQRIMRIHGRQHRPEAVRRTLRRLEQRLADLGEAEPSEATQRVAERQLRPATSSGARA